METQVINATEYRNVSLALLNESKTNPRRTFEPTALKELAESIRTQGVLSPLLVRPLTENGFEIVAGARRYRAAQMTDAPIRTAIKPRSRHMSPRPSPRNRNWCRSAPRMAGRRKAVRYSRATSTPPFRVKSRRTSSKLRGRSTKLASSPRRPSSPRAATLAPSKVCANPSCPVHHPKQQASRDDEKWKSEQEKQRKEQAIANATGLRVLAAVSAAVPVRLMKRDLLFVIEKLVGTLDESRIEMLARQHCIRQKRDDGGVAKTLGAFLRRADEGTLSRLLVESSILLAVTRGNPSTILKDAATAYKVNTDAIAAKVKQEFAAKEKAKKATSPATKAAKKAA